MEIIGPGGLSMPKLGFGTWQMSGRECRHSVEQALALGYRHIDTAEMYGNEEAIGGALSGCGLPREEIFLASKVWHDHLEPAVLRRSCHASLRRLRTDYLDLYLIHWPAPGMNLRAALEAMMRLKDEGKIRHLGVSNFTVALMREAVEGIGAAIACNQVEYHVLLDQGAVLDFARAHGIAVSAYRPLAEGRLGEFPELVRIAAKHGASVQQIALKWLLDQEMVAAIPKAAHEAHQKANLAALSITLDDEDRRVIAALPKDQRLVDPSFSPSWDPPRARAA
ncbi:MAG TPA: aldo/keto reductase [Acetobacteraceae bacterium]|nr:aldo/keto reductase [Acetobacteraceae bacterium]